MMATLLLGVPSRTLVCVIYDYDYDYGYSRELLGKIFSVPLIFFSQTDLPVGRLPTERWPLLCHCGIILSEAFNGVQYDFLCPRDVIKNPTHVMMCCNNATVRAALTKHGDEKILEHCRNVKSVSIMSPMSVFPSVQLEEDGVEKVMHCCDVGYLVMIV